MTLFVCPIVNLTKTAKKTRDHKSAFVQEIRDAIDNHQSLYLFSYENMRSQKFKNIRMYFRGETDIKASRIFLGKNKLMQVLHIPHYIHTCFLRFYLLTLFTESITLDCSWENRRR
jgi:hypothetical protein